MRRTSDPIHLIRTANPVPDPDRMPDGPETLMEEIIGMTNNEPDRRRRRKRIPILVVALIGTAIGIAAATSWFINPSESTSIACGGEVIIDARSGDPIADCAAELDRRGIDHGELVAYANESGSVTVTDNGGFRLTPLGDDFRQDLTIIKLRETLADHVAGLASRCFEASDALDLAESSMTDLGIEWPISVREDPSRGTRCAVGIVDEIGQTVIIAMDVGPTPDEYASADPEPWTPMIDQLTQRLTDECVPLNEAVVLADQIAIDTGVGYMTELSAVEDPAAACTTASVDVGGLVFLVLRGPVEGAVPASVLPTPMPTDG